MSRRQFPIKGLRTFSLAIDGLADDVQNLLHADPVALERSGSARLKQVFLQKTERQI